MKKGFTLVELLMVMVIVGALVAVAIPKYQRALERSRALEGLTNARAAADYANSYYLTHNSTYPSSIPTDDLVKSQHFDTEKLTFQPKTGDPSTYIITLPRVTAKGWLYQIKTSVSGGEITELSCENKPEATTDDCAELDLTGNLLQ